MAIKNQAPHCHPGNTCITYGYDLIGNVNQPTLNRDLASRITAIDDPVYDAAFNYDANGNILYQSRNIGDLSTGYDALDKLTTATGPLDSYAYAYDRNANRLTDILNDASTTYFLDAC